MTEHLTPTAVYLLVMEAFRRTADTIEPIDPAGAATLRRASTHWLRHSAASHQADAGTDIRFIQKNLRHASIETTGLYLHAEDDRRHTHTVGERRLNDPQGSCSVALGDPASDVAKQEADVSRLDSLALRGQQSWAQCDPDQVRDRCSLSAF